MSLNFNQYASEGNEFMNGLAKELGYPEDRARAARVLRVVLHAIRDLIPTSDSIRLLSQLPFFLKGVYAENWTMKTKMKRLKHADELIDLIKKKEGATATHDFENDDKVEIAIAIIFTQLRKYISIGELGNIKATLPKEIKPLLGPFMMF